MNQDLISAAEAADLLDLPSSTVRKMADSGDLPGSWETHEGKLCISRDAILQFRDQLTTEQREGLQRLAEDVAEMGLYDRPDADEPVPQIDPADATRN